MLNCRYSKDIFSYTYKKFSVDKEPLILDMSEFIFNPVLSSLFFLLNVPIFWHK